MRSHGSFVPTDVTPYGFNTVVASTGFNQNNTGYDRGLLVPFLLGQILRGHSLDSGLAEHPALLQASNLLLFPGGSWYNIRRLVNRDLPTNGS